MASAASGPAGTEKLFDYLLPKIKKDQCTPFLGAEVYFGKSSPFDDEQRESLRAQIKEILLDPRTETEDLPSINAVPPASLIAEVLAEAYDYPWNDTHDLARVAQFGTTRPHDWFRPREDVRKILRQVRLPRSEEIDEPHSVLARLPLSVYVTTTYYNFMAEALTKNPTISRRPKVERCRWNENDPKDPEAFHGGTEINAANPLVYHLYGHIDKTNSLVLTEDDFFDFLINTSVDRKLFPAQLHKAFTNSALLFIGYHFDDTEFRVLLRILASFWKTGNLHRHLSVQFVTEGERLEQSQLERAKELLSNYCDDLRIDVYYGTARAFMAHLKGVWDDYSRRS